MDQVSRALRKFRNLAGPCSPVPRPPLTLPTSPAVCCLASSLWIASLSASMSDFSSSSRLCLGLWCMAHYFLGCPRTRSLEVVPSRVYLCSSTIRTAFINAPSFTLPNYLCLPVLKATLRVFPACALCSSVIFFNMLTYYCALLVPYTAFR